MEKKSRPAATEQLEREILVYLTSHPHAADTEEGIAQWWIARGGDANRTRDVRQAIERLLRAGLIETATLRGSAVYRARRR